MTQQPTSQPASNLATLGDRLRAFLFDILIPFSAGAATVPLRYVGGDGLWQAVLGIFVVFFVIVQFVLIAKRSQTLGKHLLNIYVVEIKTGKRCGFWRLWLLRDVVGRSLIIGTLPILSFTFQPVYFIVDTLFIFRKDRRTVHDMIGGTVVCRVPDEHTRKKLLDFTALP